MKPLKRLSRVFVHCTGLKPGVNESDVSLFGTNMNRLTRSVESPRVLNIEDLRRKAKQQQRAPPAKQESFVRFQRFRDADSRTSRSRREAQYGISFILSGVATVLWPVLTARARLGFLRSSSPSTRQSQV